MVRLRLRLRLRFPYGGSRGSQEALRDPKATQKTQKQAKEPKRRMLTQMRGGCAKHCKFAALRDTGV